MVAGGGGSVECAYVSSGKNDSVVLEGDAE